jgi:uncharacterized protein
MSGQNPKSASELKSFFLEGPVGRLEALLNTGSETATHAAIVCHPHPQAGGTMHNRVVYRTMKALNAFGFPVLRFNYRGVGLSQGVYDMARGEADDVRAGLDWLHEQFQLPIIFAGYSFSTFTGVSAACPDERVTSLIFVGTPLRTQGVSLPIEVLQNCEKPKLFISGTRDEFASTEELEQLVKSVPEPKQLTLVEGADHFFATGIDKLQATIDEWVKKQL